NPGYQSAGTRDAEMIRLKAFCMFCLVCGVWFSAIPVEAARPASTPTAADNPDVARVLRDEVAGAVDRRSSLAELLRSRSDLATPHWQAGFVREGESWRSFDDASQSAVAREKLDHYRERRAAAPATPAGQLQLADWCRQQGLRDQEQAHLFSAVALDPQGDHSKVLERLGFRRIGGRWLSREQLVEWRSLNRQTEESLKHWKPKLDRIARQLAAGTRQRATGLASLKEITVPSAIPAIELTLAGRDEASAVIAIEAFARIEQYEASIALARQGIFSKWAGVRTAAAQALKSRSFEHFVPQLVALLSSPIQKEVVVRRFGVVAVDLPGSDFTRAEFSGLFYSYIMKREIDDQFQVATFNTFNSLIDDNLTHNAEMATPNRRGGAENAAIARELDAAALARGRTDTIRAFHDDVERKDREVTRQNQLISEVNERVGEVLGTVSGKGPSADPQTWWGWWTQQNDVASTGNKRVVQIVNENDTVGDVTPRYVPRCECFAAGTLVWTESGPMAIETIRIGDRVLAKDIETGELDYKPVVQTTVRPPRELNTLRLDDERIVCTGGHRFWISGLGWVRARDLAPASLVHTATGNKPIWSARKGESVETYNLVVADFHTYFVGNTGVLCHDLLIPRPTNKVVPGLDRSQLAASERTASRSPAE
ncbi:MAG TPA: polymorphic toxin-type HINT domain-containing protein, partial [Planctomycetaceae bacterium]|nr:polymorphic toxin-type HINT domain-containing protein [Planctomycetaceae bacterium]